MCIHLHLSIILRSSKTDAFRCKVNLYTSAIREFNFNKWPQTNSSVCNRLFIVLGVHVSSLDLLLLYLFTIIVDILFLFEIHWRNFISLYTVQPLFAVIINAVTPLCLKATTQFFVQGHRKWQMPKEITKVPISNNFILIGEMGKTLMF